MINKRCKLAYNSKFNDINLDLTQHEWNLLFISLYMVRENKEKTINKRSFKKMINNRRLKDELDKIIYNMVDKLEKSGNKIFSKYEAVDDIIKIELSEEYKYLFKDVCSVGKDPFVIIDLKDFLNIRSKYSKVLYKMLKQFDDTGFLIITEKKLHDRLCLSDYYISRNWEFQKLIKKSLKELENSLCFDNIECIKKCNEVGENYYVIKFDKQ